MSGPGGTRPTLLSVARVQLDPRLVGWDSWDGHDPFEDHSGPFRFRETDDGRTITGFVPQEHNLNGHGIVHGGAILTFMDYSLFALARRALGDAPGVTVGLDSHFIGAGHAGRLLEGTGEVVRATGSLIFVRGIVQMPEEDASRAPAVVASFSGIIKKLARPPAV